MTAALPRTIRLIFRHHLPGALLIVLLVSAVISQQIADRRGFADSELHHDVMERWGAPIAQPVPSVRYVTSGSIFNTLHPLSFEEQKVTVDATMNYRKRGLVYFSGFDFRFSGEYAVHNGEAKSIDIVFVFPINLDKNKILLSDLGFEVDGNTQAIILSESGDALLWTGRLEPGENRRFGIRFTGRGLDSFSYLLDPDLPVRNFELTMRIKGGANIDYADGIVPASRTTEHEDTLVLGWKYPSLESGIPVGVILPSEKAFDAILVSMVRRAWVPFLGFFGVLTLLAIHHRRPLAFYESYLFAACYGFFFVLLAYLAAFLPFYAAYPLALFLIGGMIVGYAGRVLTAVPWWQVASTLGLSLVIPTAAVIAEGYTGLVYCLEIFLLLGILARFTTAPTFQRLLDDIFHPSDTAEVSHAL